jgi:hypothetical protein
VFGIFRPEIGPSELMSATLTACHAIKRSPFGLLFAVLDSPCAQLAGIEMTQDCSVSMESCVAEKLREPRNSSIQNSHNTKKRFHWINALSLVSTMVHYNIMIKYDRLA